MVLVHGSGADADGWTSFLSLGNPDLRMVAYDRRGTPRSPLPEGATRWGVADHAADLLALVEEETDGQGRPIAVGSSFGAVCVLEAARTRPDLFSGVVLIEPPLPDSDDGPAVPESFMERMEALAEEVGGPSAAAFFLRTVLGAGAFEAMPARWRDRACALHAAIRLDCQALLDYRTGYAELGRLDVPTMLVGGGRSAPWFGQTLHALHRAIPGSRLEVLEGAGHMLHAEAARRFHRLVMAFIEQADRGP